EIACAAGVSEAEALAVLGGRRFVPYDEAIAVARLLLSPDKLVDRSFAHSLGPIPHAQGVPLAVSSTCHALALTVAIFLTAALAPTAAVSTSVDVPRDTPRLVFLAPPGPGGGGGGGGLKESTPPPAAKRQGRQPVSSPLPTRRPPPAKVAFAT